MKNNGIRVASKLRYRQSRELVTKKQATKTKTTSTSEKRRVECLVFDTRDVNCAVTKTRTRAKTLN